MDVAARAVEKRALTRAVRERDPWRRSGLLRSAHEPKVSGRGGPLHGRLTRLRLAQAFGNRRELRDQFAHGLREVASARRLGDHLTAPVVPYCGGDGPGTD
jgi:hypothetical protein